MDKCSSLAEALQLAILLHGPFHIDQLDTEKSRFHLFTQLEELYWHILDEYRGPGAQSNHTNHQLDIYSLFFERTANKIWGGYTPTRSSITGWLQDYNYQIKNIPVYGALILNHTMDKVLLSGNHFGDRETLVYTPPRGKRDEGETPQETAIREVREETGLDIAPFLIPDEFVKFKPNHGTRTVQLFVVVTPLAGNEPIPVPKRLDNQKNNNEVNKLTWFPLQDSTPHGTRTTSGALRLLMSWCHSKILNPASNRNATANVLLRPITGSKGKLYHFNPKALLPNKNVEFPSVYNVVKTYTAVCAGLLSVNFSTDLVHLYSPMFSAGPQAKEHFGYNEDQYDNNGQTRSRTNSNSRRHSPQPNHHNKSDCGNKPASSTQLAQQQQQHPAAPAINLDELFGSQVSLDDVFAQSAVATAAPPQYHHPVSPSTGSISSRSHIELVEDTSVASQHSTIPAQKSSENKPPTSSYSTPLAHLIPPHISATNKGPVVSTPTPSISSLSVAGGGSKLNKTTTTAPAAPPVIVAAAPPRDSGAVSGGNGIGVNSSKLGNLKMKMKGPIVPLQPLAPK